MGYIGTPVLIDSADGVYWYILKSAGILVHSQSEMGYIGTFPYNVDLYVDLDLVQLYVPMYMYHRFLASPVCTYY